MPDKNEFGVDYQIYVLKAMHDTLPESLAVPLNAQLAEIAKSFKEEVDKFRISARAIAEDITLEVKSMQFDLEATKSEKEELQRKLDEMNEQ